MCVCVCDRMPLLNEIIEFKNDRSQVELMQATTVRTGTDTPSVPAYWADELQFCG